MTAEQKLDEINNAMFNEELGETETLNAILAVLDVETTPPIYIINDEALRGDVIEGIMAYAEDNPLMTEEAVDAALGEWQMSQVLDAMWDAESDVLCKLSIEIEEGLTEEKL